MRWWMLVMLCCGMLLPGCEEKEQPAQRVPASVLTFRYDAARDVVVAATHPFTPGEPVTAQTYASLLARLPDSSYAPAETLRLADPQPAITGNALAVNYRQADGLTQLSSAQATAILAALEGWRWTPEIREVTVLAQGRPLTTLGPVVLAQPLAPAYYTYVIQPQTGEVAHLVGALMPKTLEDALNILQRREISDFPETQGFRPLLPEGTAIAASLAQAAPDGTITVNLPAGFPRTEKARLAGIVLMLAQFPSVKAVQFTFGGKVIDEPFYRSNLNKPVTPYDLLLPEMTAAVATVEARRTIQQAVETSLGRTPPPVDYGAALVWRDWAAVPVTLTAGAPPKLYLLRQRAQGYTVQAGSENPTAILLQETGIPASVLIAFRVPGWEGVALAEGD